MHPWISLKFGLIHSLLRYQTKLWDVSTPQLLTPMQRLQASAGELFEVLMVPRVHVIRSEHLTSL